MYCNIWPSWPLSCSLISLIYCFLFFIVLCIDFKCCVDIFLFTLNTSCLKINIVFVLTCNMVRFVRFFPIYTFMPGCLCVCSVCVWQAAVGLKNSEVKHTCTHIGAGRGAHCLGACRDAHCLGACRGAHCLGARRDVHCL